MNPQELRKKVGEHTHTSKKKLHTHKREESREEESFINVEKRA